MKTVWFFVIICLLIAVASSLLVLVKVMPEQEKQNGETQVSTKKDVVVAPVPEEKSVNAPAPETLDNRPEGVLSESSVPVAFANSASKTVTSPPQDSPVAEDKPGLNLSVSQKPQGLPVSGDSPDLSVSPEHQLAAPDKTADKTEPDRIDVDGLYAGNPAVRGQNGELLPSPEDVLARKAQSILENYKDRKAEGVIISEEVVGEAQSGSAVDIESSVEIVIGVETVETLAEQNTSDNAADAKPQTDRLLAALAEGNPADVRLQAIYLLADVAPDQVRKFLNDKDDLVRCEAERIVGVLPADY
jgi:hypothetical protein